MWPLRLSKIKNDAVLAIIGIFVGFVLMSISGFILGAVSGGMVMQSGSLGKWSGLANDFSFMIAMPIPILLFGVIGFGLRNWLVALYPIIMWQFGGLTVGILNHFMWFIIDSVPDIEKFGSISPAITAATAYGFSYLILGPIYLLVKTITTNKNAKPYSRTVAYVCILLLNIGIVAAVSHFGHSLYFQQQRSRTLIHVPSTSSVVGSAPVVLGVDGKILQYNVSYTEPTEQSSGRYQYYHGVTVYHAKHWWQADSKSLCGSAFTSHGGGQAANDYRTSPGGVTYAISVHDINTNSPSDSEGASKIYAYCWAVGNYKYTTELDSRHDLELLRQHPIEMTIDIISSAPAHSADCSLSQDKQRYCTKEDIDRLAELGGILR